MGEVEEKSSTVLAKKEQNVVSLLVPIIRPFYL